MRVHTSVFGIALLVVIVALGLNAPVRAQVVGGGLLLNGSFDDYQPYMREDEHKYWREFPESYGARWDLVLISEADRRIHPMDSGTFGKFTQKYFGQYDYSCDFRFDGAINLSDLALLASSVGAVCP